MTKHDDFGDRMKQYEKLYTSHRVHTNQILCVRIDGKGFSKFTKGFAKPFDDGLNLAMIDTTKQLVKETHAKIGYTQSDEITLIFTPSEKSSEYLFGGKVSKINSVLASMAAANFNHFIAKHAPTQYAGKGLAYFDCRAWAVPDITEASNVILWRVQDARKNSISALFRWTAGHKKMNKLDQKQMKQYLLEHNNVDWNDLPNKYKYGTFVKAVTRNVEFDSASLNEIPIKYREEARNAKRSFIEEIDVGYFGDLSLEQRMDFIQ